MQKRWNHIIYAEKSGTSFIGNIPKEKKKDDIKKFFSLRDINSNF